MLYEILKDVLADGHKVLVSPHFEIVVENDEYMLRETTTASAGYPVLPHSVKDADYYQDLVDYLNKTTMFISIPDLIEQDNQTFVIARASGGMQILSLMAFEVSDAEKVEYLWDTLLTRNEDGCWLRKFSKDILVGREYSHNPFVVPWEFMSRGFFLSNDYDLAGNKEAVEKLTAIGINERNIRLLERIGRAQDYESLVEQIDELLNYYVNSRDYELAPKEAPREPLVISEADALYPKTVISPNDMGFEIGKS